MTIWPDCDVQIYTPLDTVGAEWWAEYEPLQSEVRRALHFISGHVAIVGWGHRGEHSHGPSPQVQHNLAKGMDEKAATAAAVRYTWNANMAQVDEAVGKLVAELPDMPLIVVGVSNGAIVASELAIRAHPKALWLASGVPALVCNSAYDACSHTIMCMNGVVDVAAW